MKDALEQQNAVVPAGFFEAPTERVQLRITGAFDSVEEIRDFPIHAGGRTIRLGDVATVTRGFSDPAAPRMRFMGEDAIGIAVAMKQGGDILKLGETLEHEFNRLQESLPAGMELRKVSDQPAAVEESVGEFVRVLAEAVAIVLLVSFFSLGFRTGMVVAVSIPLVLAMTFAVMHYFGIGLHKISLGALVLALGLLVDDAIIAVEMMAIKMEQGFSRLKAASFAYESTAFPMLTGTLVTAAGFLPIATAASSTGEYTRSLFQVVTIALIVSWIAAVLFIPYLGDKMLPDMHKPQAPKHGSLPARWNALRARAADRWPAFASVLAPPQPHDHAHDPYASKFYVAFRNLLDACLRRRWLVIGLTVAAFVLSVMMFRFVPQQFFPDSTRVELMVDMELAEGVSLRSTEAQAKKLEKLLATREGIDNYVAYVGTGSPRFYLPLDQQLPQANFSQFVVPREGRRGARRTARLADQRCRAAVPRTAVARDAPGERPAGRLSGAVPRLRRTHRPRARHRQAGRSEGAREPERRQREPRLGRAQQGGEAGARPGPCARAGREFGAAGELPLRLAVRPERQHLPRRQRAGADAVARPAGRARAHRPARQPGRAHGKRKVGAAGADRQARICVRGRRDLASRPPADGDRARRYPQQARPRRPSSRRSRRRWTTSAASCPKVICCRPAVRSRTRRAARTRSTRACRCSCWP